MKNGGGTVGVVLVNWNGWRHTVEACKSVDGSTHQSIELIIVDNASADDSISQLRAAVPHAHIIASAVNTGFAGASNIGTDCAVSLGCEYVFHLNNDALVESDTISTLVSASKVRNDDVLLGSAIRFFSSGEYQFFGSRTGNIFREPEFLTIEKDGTLLGDDFIETDFVVGAALFIPLRLLGAIGRFDERFFLNYEEVDVCYRARARGIRSFVVPASVVHHHANTSMGSYPAPMQAYFLSRNGSLFAEKHGPYEQRRAFFRLKTLYWDIRRTLRTAPGKSFMPVCATLRGYWDYTFGLFGDCPSEIRRMDAAFRGKTFQSSSRIPQAGFWKARINSILQSDQISASELSELLARTLAVAAGTLVLGGFVLSAFITFFAGMFRSPEFANIAGLPFAMSGGLGVVIASWFLGTALRQISQFE